MTQTSDSRRVSTFEPVRQIPVSLCVGGRELTEPRLSPDGSRLGWVESTQGVARLRVVAALSAVAAAGLTVVTAVVIFVLSAGGPTT